LRTSVPIAALGGKRPLGGSAATPEFATHRHARSRGPGSGSRSDRSGTGVGGMSLGFEQGVRVHVGPDLISKFLLVGPSSLDGA